MIQNNDEIPVIYFAILKDNFFRGENTVIR